MKQQIIQALEKSLIHNQEVQNLASQALTLLGLNQKYCLTLMEITDDVAVDNTIRLAAIVQLKANVQRRWSDLSAREKPTATLSNLIPEDEKEQIRQYLLTALIRCQSNQPIVKNYKSIISQVVTYDHEKWLPTEQLCEVLTNQPQNWAIAIVFAEAVVSSFTERPMTSREGLDRFVQKIFPLMYRAMTGEHKSLLTIYLGMRVVERAFKCDLSDTMKEFVPMWMPLIKEVIDHRDESLRLDNAEKKNTNESLFFRTKKWALKALYKFFQTHSSYSYKKHNQEYAESWLHSYAEGFLHSLAQEVKQVNLPRAKYYILKCFTCATHNKPSLLLPYCQFLLFDAIPGFTKLVPEDERLAKEDPLELMRRDEDVLGIDGNIKMAAVYLFTTLVDIGNKSAKEGAPQVQGPNLKTSIVWISEQLASLDLLSKELGMLLLCRCKYIYVRFSSLKTGLAATIQQWVLPHLAPQVSVLVRSRAIQVFQEYGYLDFTGSSSLQQLVQYLYTALKQKGNVIVNIRAACAFNAVLRHQEAIQMVRPYLKDLLECYLRMITEHEIENLVASLEGIIQHYTEEIGPFAVDLVAYLSRQFIKFSESNNEVGDNDEGQLELAAIACIDVVRQVVGANIGMDSLLQIQPFIISILQEAFTFEGSEYIQYAFQLLSLYLYKVDSIDKGMWFFYPCILYNILGRPDGQTVEATITLDGKEKKIIEGLPKVFVSENLQQGLNCIRNFMYKSPQLALQEKDFFGIPMLYTLCRIFEHVYKRTDRLPEEMLGCTAILLNVFENTKPPEAIVKMGSQLIKFNLVSKAITLKSKSCELFCLMLMRSPEATLRVFDKSHLQFFLKLTIEAESNYRLQYEISRVIVGVSTVFLAKIYDGVRPLLGGLFRLIVKLVKSIYSKRCTVDLEDSFSETDADSEVNYWTEARDKQCRTLLDKTDAVAYFQTCWTDFTSKEPELSSNMTALLSEQQLKSFGEYVAHAKQEFARSKTNS